MFVNYLILAHKSPNQFKQLVNALDAPWVRFYVHIDKKQNIIEFKNSVKDNQRVQFVCDESRIDGSWGDLSLVEAALSCMRLMLSCGTEGHSVLLSGQDYPLRKASYIRDFFETHKDGNYMSVYPIPDPKKSSEGGGMERLISYTFNCKNQKNLRMKAKIQPLSLRLKTFVGFIRLLCYRRDLIKFAIKAYFKKRVYPKRLAKHFNEFWCALNWESVEYLVGEYDSRPELKEYYKYTHIPDETLFSSVLMMKPEFEKTLHPMCHYIDWSGSNDGSPKTIGMADLPKIYENLANNDYVMFARKFAENTDVLEKIDLMIK